VINPCWVPSEELPKVGYTGYLEDYKALEQYWEEETKSIDTELCIGCFAPEALLVNHIITTLLLS
jgi:hypothetical protein